MAETGDIPLMSMLKERMSWLTTRQEVLSQHVAGAKGGTRQEQEGIQHRLTLALIGARWSVIADEYVDTAELGYLKAAQAPAAMVRASRICSSFLPCSFATACRMPMKRPSRP